jgi:hypothetical protein
MQSRRFDALHHLSDERNNLHGIRSLPERSSVFNASLGLRPHRAKEGAPLALKTRELRAIFTGAPGGLMRHPTCQVKETNCMESEAYQMKRGHLPPTLTSMC